MSKIFQNRTLQNQKKVEKNEGYSKFWPATLPNEEMLKNFANKI